MRTFLTLCVGLLAVAVFAGCGGEAKTPAATAPSPTAVPVASVVKLDVTAGLPPAAGWRWAVAEYDTATEASDGPHAHDLSWLFIVIDGSMELTVGSERKLVAKGEAVFVAAGQEHAHRYAPTTRALFVQLRPADNPPGALHRGRQAFVSESPIAARAGQSYKLRLQEQTFPAGARTADGVAVEPSFIYVVEGALTVQAGSSAAARTVTAGGLLEMPSYSRYTLSNEGAAPVKLLLVDLRP